MSPTTRNILLSCGILALTACICLSCMAVAFIGVNIYQSVISTPVTGLAPTDSQNAPDNPFQRPTQTPGPTRTPRLTATPMVSATPGSLGSTPGGSLTPTLTPTPCQNGACLTPTLAVQIPIPAEVNKQMDAIEKQVADYRGLTPNKTVARHLITAEQVRQRMVSDLQKDYSPEESRKDALVYTAAGLLPAGFDLLTFQQDLLSEGVAGFYDTDTNEMFILQGGKFSGEERLTYAHEYTHALQFQNFDIVNGLRFDTGPCKLESERCAAIQAIIEGDATISEQYWYLNDSTPQDKTDVQNFYANFHSPVFDRAPEFIKDEFTFPYREGAAFVSYIYKKGGWAAVDDLFKNPPVSTEQILHPERYPADKPVKVELPDLTATLGEGWKELDRNEMGAWDTYLILAEGDSIKARQPTKTAQTAAEGWGGDQYLYSYNETAGKGVFVLHTQWDTDKDASEFTAAFQKYGTGRWGAQPAVNGATLTWSPKDSYVVFSQNGLKTTWIIGPDRKTVEAIEALIS